MTAQKGDIHPNHKGNQYWKLRSKHGRDKIFSSPEMVIEALNEYLEFIDHNPVPVPTLLQAGKRAGEIVNVMKPRATTIESFCNFIGITVKTFANYEKDEGYKDFFQAFTRVRQVCDQQLLDETLAGNLNPATAIRKLGLAEKMEEKQTVKIKQIKTTLQTNRA